MSRKPVFWMPLRDILFRQLGILTLTFQFAEAQFLAESSIDLPGVPANSWTKEPGIRVDVDEIDNFVAGNGTVLFVKEGPFLTPDGTQLIGTNYLRFYYGSCDPCIGMRSAISLNEELTWTKEPGVRIAAERIFHPSLIRLGDILRIYFEASGTGGIKSAFSLDGLN